MKTMGWDCPNIDVMGVKLNDLETKQGLIYIYFEF
jgi:hypothetical protein